MYTVLTNLTREIKTVGMINGQLVIVHRWSEHVAKTDDFRVAKSWARWAVRYAGQPDTKIVVE